MGERHSDDLARWLALWSTPILPTLDDGGVQDLSGLATETIRRYLAELARSGCLDELVRAVLLAHVTPKPLTLDLPVQALVRDAALLEAVGHHHAAVMEHGISALARASATRFPKGVAFLVGASALAEDWTDLPFQVVPILQAGDVTASSAASPILPTTTLRITGTPWMRAEYPAHRTALPPSTMAPAATARGERAAGETDAPGMTLERALGIDADAANAYYAGLRPLLAIGSVLICIPRLTAPSEAAAGTTATGASGTLFALAHSPSHLDLRRLYAVAFRHAAIAAQTFDVIRVLERRLKIAVVNGLHHSLQNSLGLDVDLGDAAHMRRALTIERWNADAAATSLQLSATIVPARFSEVQQCLTLHYARPSTPLIISLTGAPDDIDLPPVLTGLLIELSRNHFKHSLNTSCECAIELTAASDTWRLTLTTTGTPRKAMGLSRRRAVLEGGESQDPYSRPTGSAWIRYLVDAAAGSLALEVPDGVAPAASDPVPISMYISLPRR